MPGIHYINIVLEYFYLGLLIMCFILSLGNRPQGSKWGYTLAFIGFGIITIYMTVKRLSLLHLRLLSWRAFYSQTSAFLLAFKGIQVIQKEKGAPLDVSDFFANTIFRNIVVSLLATFGLYVAASVIFVSRRILPCTSEGN
jgi:chitin synthase